MYIMSSEDGLHRFEVTNDLGIALEQLDVDNPGYTPHFFFITLDGTHLETVVTMGMHTGCGISWGVTRSFSSKAPEEFEPESLPPYVCMYGDHIFKPACIKYYITRGFWVLLVRATDGACQYPEFKKLLENERVATCAKAKEARAPTKHTKWSAGIRLRTIMGVVKLRCCHVKPITKVHRRHTIRAKV
jgi:hypothetical protein